jgi:transcriptional regulator with XRE-family HTH domain
MLRAAPGGAQKVAMEPILDFPALLRHHRLIEGLSQEALAERAGLSVRGISDLERGERRAPHPATLARLADALRLDDASRATLMLAARGAGVPAAMPVSSRSDAEAAAAEAPLRLVERQEDLGRLGALFGEVLAGHGRMVLLGGEAGVGKSVLVQHFAASIQDRARVRIGACDPLSTPTALGPLVDVADSLGEPLASLLASAAPGKQVFNALLTTLSGGDRPTVLVFEDAHWADEATLDLMRFLGRRIAGVGGLLAWTRRCRQPRSSVLGRCMPRAPRRRGSMTMSQRRASQRAQGSRWRSHPRRRGISPSLRAGGGGWVMPSSFPQACRSHLRSSSAAAGRRRQANGARSAVRTKRRWRRCLEMTTRCGRCASSEQRELSKL